MVLELVLAAGAVVLAARSVLADNMEVCGTALSAYGLSCSATCSD